jgi:hypothetical protein
MTPLVDVMLIGAQKSGTTALAQQLGAHPQICLSREKEPAYFNEHEDWRAGLDDYHALFSPSSGQLCLEASTMYTFLPEFGGTHERIQAYNPEVKLIYVMRDPVERMLSNYAFRRVRRLTADPPEVALVKDPTFVNRSRYGMQLRPYFDHFSDDQIHLMVFEEHVADPAGSLKEIAGFLGIAPDAFPAVDPAARHASTGEARLSDRGRRLKRHPISGRAVALLPGPVRRLVGLGFRTTLEEKPSVSAEMRERLWRQVEDDVAQVERWLGRPVQAWSRPL